MHEQDPLFPRVAQEMRALEDAPPITLLLTAMQAWCLLSQLQLALRHPQNTGPIATLARQVARTLQAAVAPPGSALYELAERAWQGE
jgi:hypothetical protein